MERIEFEDDGALLLEGTVARLAQKKLTLRLAAAVPGVSEIVDRLHLAPVAPHRHIRDQIVKLFVGSADFSNFEVFGDVAEGEMATEFVPVTSLRGDAAGRIEIEVNSGVVTLNGTVPSLVHKRLAGAMAWRVKGVRDVINGIVVEPAEEDGPDQIEEAVQAVLRQDRAVDAEQIRVGVRGRVVRLTGLVTTLAAREIAEDDAWAVLGVDDVLNEIEVRP